MRSKKEFTVRTAICFGLLLMTPLAFADSGGLEPNLACSRAKTDNCAREIDSVCTAGSRPTWNYYTKADS
jgi:hypothetical protein